MDFLLSVMHSVPFLKNVFTQKKKQPLSASRSDLECIAPLFQSVQENPHPIPTQVTGTIPEWIHGSLLRNGPGKFEFGKDMYKHWFDGMSLMHKFTMKNGSVSYMSKFLQSDTYQINKRENRIVISEFGTCALPDPCRSLFQRFMSMFEMPQVTDNGNINFMQYQGDYYVSTETNVIYKVDPEMLETRDKVDWSRYIAVNAATAHPHYDPDGTAYNMGNSYGSQGTFYNIIRIPAQESEEENILHGAQVLCSIPAKDKLKPSYYHSFGMTENYAVFVEQPLKLNILKILTSNISGSTISDCLSWEAKFDNIFHVINKHTGEIHPVTFHAKPFVTIHQINAFEDQGCIVLDLCCIDDGGFIHNYALQNLRKSGQALDEVYNSSARAFPRRFVLPLNIDSSTPYDVDLNPLSYTSSTAVKRADGKVWCTHQDLHDHRLEDLGGFEFPHINYSKSNTRNYRYFYGCGFQHLVGSSLIKVNLITKDLKEALLKTSNYLLVSPPRVEESASQARFVLSKQTIKLTKMAASDTSKKLDQKLLRPVWKEDGFYPSEPVFVPCPDAVEEDDGVILSVVVTPRQDKNTFLLVLDAKSFSELGRAEVPVQMPYGFHGMFVSHRREAFI